jgi:hypothetical protein
VVGTLRPTKPITERLEPRPERRDLRSLAGRVSGIMWSSETPVLCRSPHSNPQRVESYTGLLKEYLWIVLSDVPSMEFDKPL